ncbi:universal stress protein [Mycobacterium sp. 663a-19]|uniref:universal stress protein n=1 Tax=Mycobacterium sp. 663a-19 TaxID=2986148 RepID=UPI002D1EBAB3|nr:universal stress protein [Mycobacterium sp. 663a-19]MEB3981604.1 universal stress protein [Mycobacterium sp. 663a-19]
MSASAKQLGIVVAVDGSPASNAAVSWAAREAAMRNVCLTVVHAVVTPTTTWPPVPYPDSLVVRLEDEGKKLVMHAIKIAEDAADRKVTINRELVYSTPALALLKMSDEAQLVVVGSSGRGLLARGVLGSVSSTVVRHAKCPVAVIRDDDESPPDPQHAPVLVGIDGSPASELATEIAFDVASRRGVDLMALHAWSDVAVLDLAGLDWAAVEAEAERSLAESLAGWQERYPDVAVYRLLVRDRPARQIVEKSEGAQLVVVGSHGRGGLAGMLGSVSNAVLHSVHRPLIVARPS